MSGDVKSESPDDPNIKAVLGIISAACDQVANLGYDVVYSISWVDPDGRETRAGSGVTPHRYEDHDAAARNRILLRAIRRIAGMLR